MHQQADRETLKIGVISILKDPQTDQNLQRCLTQMYRLIRELTRVPKMEHPMQNDTGALRSRLQWISYKTENKQLIATRGGNQTTIHGKYPKNIAFFSKTSSRIDASLEFDLQRIADHGHHQGYSSKGDPLFEIWSKRAPQQNH